MLSTLEIRERRKGSAIRVSEGKEGKGSAIRASEGKAGKEGKGAYFVCIGI